MSTLYVRLRPYRSNLAGICLQGQLQRAIAGLNEFEELLQRAHQLQQPMRQN